MYSFKFDNFVDELVKKVNETSLNGFYKPYNIRIKDDGSIVTDVDILVEKNIREILSNYFPEDSIFGEELGFTKGNSSRVWIIDPIDGTTAFSQRRPEWGTLIASYENTILDTGIVICPIQDIYVAVMKNKLIRCPRDSKKQEIFFKKSVIRKEVKKGDLLFWKGHVAIALNKKECVHAYGPAKKVVKIKINRLISKLTKKSLELSSIKRPL